MKILRAYLAHCHIRIHVRRAGCVWHTNAKFGITSTCLNRWNNKFSIPFNIINCASLSDEFYLPEKMLAIAAIKKLRTTPGPAIVLATIPATRYIPVPQHEPTPNDVRSSVVRHFFFIYLLNGKSHWF